MSTPEQLPAGAARAWAVAQLGLDPECSRAEIQQACWARLAADEFASEGSHVEAIELLLYPDGEQTIPPPAPQFRHDFEQSLDADLARFTEQFFDLIPWQRQQQWFALASRAAAWPRQRGRLNSLKDGLAVDLHRLIDQHANAHLAAVWCGELFMSPPPARSARKLELLAGLRDPANAWMVAAARQLKQLAPEIVDLAPDLIDEISQHRHLVRRRARKRRRLAFRERLFGARNSIGIAAMIAVGALLGFLQGPSKSRPGPDRLENQLNKRQSLPIISIDVEELLKADDPYQAIATRTSNRRVVVVATGEQVARLKVKLGDQGFRNFFGMGFGEGMAQLVQAETFQPKKTSPDSGLPEQVQQTLSKLSPPPEQQPETVTIDASELLQGPQSPTHRLMMLAIQQRSQNRAIPNQLQKPRVQVRANADQIRRLSEQLTPGQFHVCFGSDFGEGLAELVKVDDPDSSAPTTASPDDGTSR